MVVDKPVVVMIDIRVDDVTVDDATVDDETVDRKVGVFDVVVAREVVEVARDVATFAVVDVVTQTAPAISQVQAEGHVNIF